MVNSDFISDGESLLMTVRDIDLKEIFGELIIV